MFPQLKDNSKNILALSVIALLAVSTTAHAQRNAGKSTAAPAPSEQSANPDKLDVTDLEKK